MAAHPALQMVAPPARLDGRLRPLARLHAVLRTPPPRFNQVPSHRRTLLGRRCIRRRSLGFLHSALRGTHGFRPIFSTAAAVALRAEELPESWKNTSRERLRQAGQPN